MLGASARVAATTGTGEGKEKSYVRCPLPSEVKGDPAAAFLDASATREKYAASAFTRDYTWRGPHSCLALPDLLQELLYAGMGGLSILQPGARRRLRHLRCGPHLLDGGALGLQPFELGLPRHQVVARRR